MPSGKQPSFPHGLVPWGDKEGMPGSHSPGPEVLALYRTELAERGVTEANSKCTRHRRHSEFPGTYPAGASRLQEKAVLSATQREGPGDFCCSDQWVTS